MPRPLRYCPPIGECFGRLTVVSVPVPVEGKGNKTFLRCRCECGTEVLKTPRALMSGHAKSCGCFNREAAAERCRSHGLSTAPEYAIWKAIRKRRYGRTVLVCYRWLYSFEDFYADMGPRPTPKHTIERIDNTGPYEPKNCKWATRHEQARNTSRNVWITFAGETKCLRDWASERGIPFNTLRYRITVGWPPGRALGFER